jgi:hypothetical protein
MFEKSALPTFIASKTGLRERDYERSQIAKYDYIFGHESLTQYLGK